MTLNKPIIFETTFARYSADAVLGEGGAGRIYRVRDDSGAIHALKLLDPSKATKDKLKRFKNELLFSIRNQHLNIITVYDHGLFNDGKKAAPFYVMPLYSSSFRALITDGLPPDKALAYFAQVLDGIEAAHLQRVVHRDLKPENVLYDALTDRLLLADFGIARFEEEALYTAVETSPNARLANFQYAAPEQRGRGLQVDARADIYALGLILNEIFTGEVPWGTGYKTIGSIAPEYAYLDAIVDEMLRQSAADRLASVEIVKQKLIGYKNTFVARQRISTLKQAVVPITDLDDPLISDPPRLINLDYDQGKLTLILQQPVNQKWIWSLQNMGNYESLWNKGPERFSFSGDKAIIGADEHEIQQIIDHFKRWLPNVNQKYEDTIRREKLEIEEQHRRKFEREIEEQEKRTRVLKNIRI